MLKVHLNFHIAGHFIREPFIIIIIIIRQSTALRDDYIVHKSENTLLTGFPSCGDRRDPFIHFSENNRPIVF